MSRASRLISWLRRFYGREAPADARVWHRWEPLGPVRLIDGRWSMPTGRIWRRRTDAGWEYRQDDETHDEFNSRQW